TVNVIRDYDVQEKYSVSLPDEITGVLNCPNQNCITNTDEPVETKFDVIDTELRCEYCENVVRGDITEYL
ncbi:MAG: aspartate carbamoyltransferase regulatory subunit, partial [Halobacteria archaeon]|nr:aspartate carbamoyltransferase regulatory subunit [Halobacteria archaeon]